MNKDVKGFKLNYKRGKRAEENFAERLVEDLTKQKQKPLFSK